MKIAAVNLTAGGISGGNKRFLEQIVPRLAANPAVTKVLFAAPAAIKAEEWLAPHPKLTLTTCRPFSLLRPAPDEAFKKTLDAFHPDAVFMATERRLNYPGAPQIVMAQNMAPLAGVATTRGTLETLRLWARRWDAGRAVKGAAAVIAPTAFVKEALIQKFALAPEKISVINYGSSPPAEAPLKPAGFPEKFGGRFIFTAGSLEYYRGVQDALGALALLKSRFPGLKLAVAGGARPGAAGYLAGLKARARKLGVAEDVFWLGHLNEREMSWCHFNCAAVAVTSRVESFCLTALEALAHGCLCVSTDSPCLPEIFGPGGAYYRAGDDRALSEALARALLADEPARAKWRDEAIARAKSFSWDKGADLIVKLLGQCL